jgi:hypothetical protein
MEIPARKPKSASPLTVVCAAHAVKPVASVFSVMRPWISGFLLMMLLLVAGFAPQFAVAQSSDPEQQKKEQEFMSEVNRKIEREFQIREKIRLENEQKKQEELEKARQADAARHQFSSMWGHAVPRYMFDSYTLSEPPLRKR